VEETVQVWFGRRPEGEDVGGRRRTVSGGARNQGLEDQGAGEGSRIPLRVNRSGVRHEEARNLIAAFGIQVIQVIGLMVDRLLVPAERAHPASPAAR
jgi:hypothetical protein